MVGYAALGQPQFTQAAEALSRRLAISGLDASRASLQSYARLYGALIGQATALAYIDAFWVLCTGAAIMFLLSFALKKNQPSAGRQVALE